MIPKRVAGVTQRSAALWRGGVRPDKGHYGHDKVEQETFPAWYTPPNGEWYKVPKDEAEMRDRLCGVKTPPGKYAARGAGKLLGWVLINRQGQVVVRNPYSGALDELGALHNFEQCTEEDGKWQKATMFAVTAKDADGTATTVYASMQAMLPWNWQSHWHPKIMRSTWDNNALDVFKAFQNVCKLNNKEYVPKEIDMTNIPVVRYTEGHPSPPRWPLPMFPTSRKPVDKIFTGWDHSDWNWNPSLFGDHRNNPAAYPELARGLDRENAMDRHLDRFHRHPHRPAGSHGYQMFGPSANSTIRGLVNTKVEDVGRAIPAATANEFRLWSVYETKVQWAKYSGCKDTTVGPWPMVQPVRDRVGNPVVLPT